VDAAERRAGASSSRVQQLEAQLKDALATLEGWESKFEQAAAEREELRHAVQAADGVAQSHDETKRLENARMESALQLERAERKRMEVQLLNLRQATVDSSRACRAERSNLRSKFQAPVLRLFDSTRQFLAMEMNAQQKQVAESMLHDVLVLHTTLQEPTAPTGVAVPETAAEGPSASSANPNE
jgi:hypothetical protein